MPMTYVPDRPAAPVARRRARVAIVLLGAVVILAAAVAVLGRSPEPGDDEAAPTPSTLPGSAELTRGIDGDAPEDTEGPTPGAIDGPPTTIAWTPAPRPTTGAATPAPVRGQSSPSTATGSGAGEGVLPVVPPPVQTPPAIPRPFYLPGIGEAPVLGPIGTDDPDDADEHEDQVAIGTTPEPEPEPEPQVHREEAPDPDEVGCPALSLYPIGGFEEGTSAELVALSPRFRELAPDEWAKPSLVCARGLELWRDLAVQRLVYEGRPDGALITAADGSSIVLRISEVEWTTYRFRYDGGPEGPNLLGYPTSRMSLGGVGIIRTTAGALVFAHPEAMGVPVVGGSWDFWMADGGPAGHMGIPVGQPEPASGPTGSERWVSGQVITGARQEFTNGWIFLPGVLTDVEAAAQPADRYEWHDKSERVPVDEEPFDYRGHIMQISGISFYVDMDGIRHWIRTTSDWSCAHWDLRADEYAVKGHDLDRYPLGVEFNCDDYRDRHR